MKDYFVERLEDIEWFLASKSIPIMNRELVLMEFASHISPKIVAAVLEKTRKLTANVCVKIDEKEVFNSPLLNTLSELDINKICLKQTLAFPKEKIAPVLYRDTPHYLKSQSAINLMQYYNKYQDRFEFFPEILLAADTLELIFPTLMAASDIKIPWIILNPDDLSFSGNLSRIKEQFNLLRMYQSFKTYVYFSLSHPKKDEWDARTYNPFRGPRHVDIDISNVCTHNCVFCGLYAPKTVARHKNNTTGKILPETLNVYKARIKRDECLDLIHSLPDTTIAITFGGAGDPFTHPNIMEFIRASRERNINVSIFSNFAYMTKEILDQLHALCSNDLLSIEFIVNISGSNPKTYIETRPNQKPKTFKRIIEHLKYSSSLFRQDGKGISFILMCVTNKLNFRNLPELVALAKDTGAISLWIKPVEIHGPDTLELLIDEEDSLEYARLARLTLFFAEKLNMPLKEKDVLELLVQEKHLELEEYDKKIAFNQQIKDALSKSPILLNYYLRTNNQKNTQDFIQLPKIFFTKEQKTLHEEYQTSSTCRERTDQSHYKMFPEIKMKVKNGGYSAKTYDKIPCHIAYEYLRVEVLGNVTPCCISNYPISNITKKNLNLIWHSDSLTIFREKLKKINIQRFHRKDPEWLFCQQCPHVDINVRFNNYLTN